MKINLNNYLKIKLELKYGKYLEYYLKQNVPIKHFFLLNSANVVLLLSTISNSYAKIKNQESAGPHFGTSFLAQLLCSTIYIIVTLNSCYPLTI